MEGRRRYSRATTDSVSSLAARLFNASPLANQLCCGLAALILPPITHRHRRERLSLENRDPVDSFLQESTLVNISASSMAYTLTATMFLLSYLFPSSISAYSSQMQDSRVLALNNDEYNVSVGETVVIPCTIASVESGIRSAKWNKNFRMILELKNGQLRFNKDYQAITKDRRFDLVIRDIQTRDKGVYQCVGTTTSGKMQFSKTLKLNILTSAVGGINRKTRIVLPRNNQIQGEIGTRLIVRCPLTTNSAVAVKSARWQKNLQEIGVLRNGKEVFKKHYQSTGRGRFDLMINELKTWDKGIYQCLGSDTNGRPLFGETVTISFDGEIPISPFSNKYRKDENKSTYVFIPNNRMVDVPIGKSVIIRCPLTKNISDTQNATWEKNWISIATFSKGKATFDPPLPKINTSEPIGIFDIVIPSVRVRDEGVYQCIKFISTRLPGSNLTTVRPQLSKTLKLRVPIPSGKPKIYQILARLPIPVDLSRKAVIGKERKLIVKCEAKRGHPGPSLVWRVGGLLLAANHTGSFRAGDITGYISRKVTDDKKAPVLFRSSVSYLKLTLPPKYNNSLILCMAMNPGSVRKRALTRIKMVDEVEFPLSKADGFRGFSADIALLLSLMCRYLLM